MNQDLHQIQSTNSENSHINICGFAGNEPNNKHNLLITKTIVNNDNIFNKTLFNKTANGFNKGKSIDNKKFNYNFNTLFKIKNKFEYSPFKPKINTDIKKQTFLPKKYPVNIKNIETNDIHNNTTTNRKLKFNLRSLDKDINHRKINISHSRKNPKSSKKVNISLPQKLFTENNINKGNKCEKRIIDRNKIMIKKENIISVDSNK